MNGGQKSSVRPSQRGAITSEPTTLFKVPPVKRGSVVDAPKIGALQGSSCSHVIVGHSGVDSCWLWYFVKCRRTLFPVQVS